MDPRDGFVDGIDGRSGQGHATGRVHLERDAHVFELVGGARVELGLVAARAHVLARQLHHVDLEGHGARGEHVHDAVVAQAHLEAVALQQAAEAARRQVRVRVALGARARHFARGPYAGRCRRIAQFHVEHL